MLAGKTIKVCSAEATSVSGHLKCPLDFIPSLERLERAGMERAQDYILKQIKFTRSGFGQIFHLTFGFDSGNNLSPPPGTYFYDPDETLSIPSGFFSPYNKIEFRLTRS
jgi:hypothetical protein